MSRGWRVEVIGALLGFVDTVGDCAAIVAAACTNVCDRLSDRYTIETDAHRAARERLTPQV